ncbi:hypothetical protein DEJ50_00140 [Streptomyces venezuelae]|uniref:DUF1648 domain-containing protein n=1 Tax=Streptomyces venezuelae TaxID=54571 RepID=A0A5P2CUB9_STRVZ|nr:hypothetical protein DEJ50_00140 [Streptomyces venezuelae]
MTVVAVAASRWESIPDPLAIHFTSDGADGFAPRALGVLGMVGFCVLEAVLCAVVAYRRSAATRSLYATAFAIPAALGCAFVMTLLANAAVADARQADWPGWQSLAPIGAAFAAAAIGALLTPGTPVMPVSRERGSSPDSLHSVGLAGTETAVWSRSASPTWAKGVFTILVAVGVAGVLLGIEELAWLGLPLGLIGLVMSLMRAAVNADGFALRLPLLPFPRVTIPLADIRQAHVRLVSPMGDLGGWGYRSLGGRRGLAFHTGEGLWLELADDREFLIVVEDAESAAGLINDLVARSATAAR